MQAKCCRGVRDRALEEHPAGSSPPVPPRAPAGSSWPWWVLSCLEVLFSAGVRSRVPGPPPLGTNADGTRLSPTAPACSKGIPKGFPAEDAPKEQEVQAWG